jgi:hypothetical protein
VHFVGLYFKCNLQKNKKNITVISLALLYALHVCDATSHDNSSSTNYAVRTICEKIMPESNWYNWLTFIACIIPDTYVFVFLEDVKHRLQCSLKSKIHLLCTCKKHVWSDPRLLHNLWYMFCSRSDVWT